MPFPLDQLRPAGGVLYGHVFENRDTGLPRGVYWTVSILFASIDVDEETWEPSLLVDWLVFPARRWTDLDGLGRADIREPELVEASFYLFDHQPGRLLELALARAGPRDFDARIAIALDLEEPDGTIRPATTIAASGRVRFDGIYVLPDNLDPPPRSPEQARTAIEPFLATADLEPPRWDRLRYVFAPKV